MKFGPASPAEAIGGVTVHTLRQGALVLKKGTTVGTAEVEALKKAGVKEIVVVRLEQGDVSEDAAAPSRRALRSAKAARPYAGRLGGSPRPPRPPHPPPARSRHRRNIRPAVTVLITFPLIAKTSRQLQSLFSRTRWSQLPLPTR